jgi:hypothetical protein
MAYWRTANHSLSTLTCIAGYLTRHSSAGKLGIIWLSLCHSGRYMWFTSVIACDKVFSVCLPEWVSVCNCNGSGSMGLATVIACDKVFSVCLPEWIRAQCVIATAVWVFVNVVILPMETASIRRRHRTRDHGERSSAQTVSLKPNSAVRNL